MKKNRTMIVVALAIVLTLSIGYALFSQTINITGTATASGSFEFTPTCTIGIDSGIIPNNSDETTVINNLISNQNAHITSRGTGTPMPTTVGGSSNNTCVVDGNQVTMTTTLAYPGALQLFTVKITNTGTISGRMDPTKYMDVDYSGSGPTNYYIVGVYIDGVNVIPANYANLSSVITQYTNHEYKPNDVVYIVYGFSWNQSPAFSYSCDGGTNCTTTYTFTLPFEQYNQ